MLDPLARNVYATPTCNYHPSGFVATHALGHVIYGSIVTFKWLLCFIIYGSPLLFKRDFLAKDCITIFNPNNAGFFDGSFYWGWSIWSVFQISSRINAISVELYSIIKQPIWNNLRVKKCWHHLLYADVIRLFATCNNGLSKNLKKVIKIVNSVEEKLHIFWTTSEIPMKFSGNMCLITILIFKNN